MRRALTILERTRERAKHSELTWLRVKMLILQALARHLLGEKTSTRDALTAQFEEALSLAQPEGYIRVFVDEGPPEPGH